MGETLHAKQRLNLPWFPMMTKRLKYEQFSPMKGRGAISFLASLSKICVALKTRICWHRWFQSFQGEGLNLSQVRKNPY
jgi:hypothetical protein